MPDIRCHHCNAKLAERHDDRIEIKMNHRWVFTSTPTEIICERCGARNTITDTSHQTEPANHTF